MNDSAGNIEIRAATRRDAKLISVLGTTTFYEAYFEQDTPPDLADYIHDAFNLEKILSEIEDPHAEFFIIFLDGRAVGYAKLRTGSKADDVKTENSIEMQRIYMVERVFGKGIGEILLNHCRQTAKERGFQTIWLGVWEENRRAQRFYEKHGFRRVGTLTFTYGDSVGINFVLERVL
ncbi:MAG TPA: GNAT family N-acetyltransferase [Pyrinomonadaceae bacterium]|jgi:ribosomal protein S18 acetylase RimI-like enzyme